MLSDLRYAFRQLTKSPGFTAVAVLSLALGIGANTAIFSALNAVLLRSLPVRNPHELRSINWIGLNPEFKGYTGTCTSGRGLPRGFEMGTSFPYPAFREFQNRGAGFTDVFACYALKSATAVTRGEASVAGTMLVSGNFFSGYGVNPLIGRTLTPEDDRPGAPPVAVITYLWWERHCGLDPNVVGQTIILNQASYTVIGVLPRHYKGPMMGDPSDIYVPMSAQPHLVPGRPLDSPNRWWVQVMGRLAPGANEAQAQASLAVLFQQVLGESNAKMGQPGIVLEDGSRGQLMLRQKAAKPFLALTVVVGLVLLVACANLATLLLARGAARQHEMAVRAAIGAGRWRLIRQSLTESLVLALAGGGLGLVVSAWIKHALGGFLSFAPEGFRFDLRTDSNVFLFTLCVSVVTALVFGLLPALRASRADPLAGLKSRSALGAPRLRLGKVLVTVQVGLSVLLVVGASLMIRTFANLARVQPGFDPQNVLLFRLDPGQAGYSGEKLITFYDQTCAALLAIPGVKAVTFSGFPLASGSHSSEGIQFPGRVQVPGSDEQTAVLGVGEDFFQTMSIPLLAGRDFTVSDNASSPLVAVVNETFARRFFGGENPVGQTFRLQDGTARAFQIVGYCRDAKYNEVRAEVPPLVFWSQRQRLQPNVTFVLRTALPPLALVPAVRKAVSALDANLPLSRIKTQEQQVEQSLAADRLFASLGGAFAFLAVLLSCIGLYGLMAYNVTRRTSEFGIRMALGATRRNIAIPILREALLLAGTGVVLGTLVVLSLVGFIKSQLYGVNPVDPLSLTTGALLLVAVAVFAAWLPARRATKVNPIEALRSE